MWASTRLQAGENDIIAPTLVILREAWNKMHAYVRAVGPVEINGFGYVEEFGSDLLLTDVFITKQTVTGGTAANTGSAFAKAQYHAFQDGKADELRLQWHSHVHGDAYHSTTDMRSIERFGQGGMEWFVSLVTNHHGDITARMDLYRPVRLGAPMEIKVVDYVNPAIQASILAEIEELVTVETPKKTGRARTAQPVTTSN